MTSYDLLLQQKLDQSRNIPLDAYSAGLVDVARLQAQHQFLSQQAEKAQEARLQQVKLEGELDIKRAKVLGESQAKIEQQREIAYEKRQQARERAQLLMGYRQQGLQPRLGETDDEFLARASVEYNKALGQHLDTAGDLAESYRAKVDKATSEAAINYQQRLRDAVWQNIQPQLSSLIKDKKLIAELNSASPLVRDAKLGQLLSDPKGAQLATAYGFAQKQALEMVPQFTAEQKVTIDSLNRAAQRAEVSRDTLLQNPKYSGAIPYTKMFKEAATPEIDTSKAAPPGASTGSRQSEIIGPPAKTVAKATQTAAVAAGMAPATPAEIFGPGPEGYGWGPGQTQPLIGSISEPVQRVGRWLGDYRTPLRGIYNAVDLAGAAANQWLGTQTLPTAETMQERAQLLAPDTSNPQLVQAALRELQLPPTLQAPQGVPTQSEIEAFRAARDVRTGPSTRLAPQDQTFNPMTVPPELMYLRPELRPRVAPWPQ